MKTFKRNLIIGFGVSLVLLVLSALFSFISIHNLLNSSDMVNHTNTVIKKLENVISLLKDAETGQRGFLLTGEEEFLEPYKGALIKSNAVVDEIKGLTADNAAQQKSIEELRSAVAKRFFVLEYLIENKRAGKETSVEDLKKGKANMDEARRLVNLMEQREQNILITRTQSLNRFAANTPVFILIASVVAIIVTIVSFLKVNSDFQKRVKLQHLLEQKDEDVTKRISVIENIAAQISSGDYSVKVTDKEKDALGSLAFSLNKMGASLERSFNELSDKEWLQTGIAKLNDKMKGEQDVETLCNNIIEFVAGYTSGAAGALYLLNENKLEFSGGFAFTPSEENKTLQIREGIAGQAVKSAREIIVQNIPADAITINYSGGEIKPLEVIAFPLFFDDRVKGVIELASLKKFSANDLSFLRSVSHITGIAINTAKNRKRLQELLEETQVQTEELQSQHSELENINAELEAQAEKLQVSEEELRVQQEELQQANEELEERTRMLEEKNHLIAEHNKDIQQKAGQLELTTKYKSEFLANMSHELRTPLNSILLLSRLLSEDNEKHLSLNEIEYAKVIQSSGQGLLSLIDEILDLSKIESGKMDLEFASVKIEEIVANMKALFIPLANEKNLELNFKISEDAPLFIETDSQRLEQILKNLLSNALKFTQQGSVNLDILKKYHQIEFKVTDTGTGIPKDKQSLIFEAFQQADGSTRRKFGGTGLGLSISRELVKLLGGEISVTSEAGKGSIFAVIIPIAKTSAGLVPEPTPNAHKEQNKEHEVRYITAAIPADIPDDRSMVSINDKVILIIEDDTAFAKTLLDYTRQKGYKAIVSVRGDEGIELAKQYKPFGILLDIQLPVRDGWEVMEELKSNNETRHIPVHIMSSYAVKKKSLLKGAVDFINKPVNFEQLQEVFEKIEHILTKNPKKVLIVEDNAKHAKALAYFLENYNVISEIKNNVSEGIEALNREDVNCVILDMGVPDQKNYDALEEVKKTPGLENLPIIIFTGKSLSKNEELHIKQYADSIVIKTAHSYKRMIDEVSLFLHLVNETSQENKSKNYKRLSQLNEVLKNKIVLVVDDDVRNIFSLTKVLETHDVKVLTAIDGKEALKEINSHPEIDLVLMDMMMPEMDGYEAIIQIRKNQFFKTLPIIAVTAKAMGGDREKCITAGASDYITKPVDIDQLLSLLRVWLYE